MSFPSWKRKSTQMKSTYHVQRKLNGKRAMECLNYRDGEERDGKPFIQEQRAGEGEKQKNKAGLPSD